MTHFILKTLHQENDSDFLNIIEIDLLTLKPLINTTQQGKNWSK